jgi:hypothetical protein
MSNRASPSPATLKSSCASADNIGLIDGTIELTMEVRCDRTQEDLICMLTEPTHCGLWITWRGLECEAAIGLVHPGQTTLQTVPIHETVLWFKCSSYIISLWINGWNTLLMTR